MTNWGEIENEDDETGFLPGKDPLCIISSC